MSVECRCTPGVGFNPLRIRPYVALPDHGRAAADPASPQPVLGAVAQPSGAPDRPPFPSDPPPPGASAEQGPPSPAPVPGAATPAPAPGPATPPQPGHAPPRPPEHAGPPASPHPAATPNPTRASTPAPGPAQAPAPGPGPAAPPPPAPPAAPGPEGEATTLLPLVPPAGPSEPQPHTPAYGIPVLAWPDQTVQLRAVPPHVAPGARSAPPAQALGGADRETGKRSRRLVLPLLAGVGALVVAGAAAVALGFTGSGTDDRALTDPKPSAPAVSVVPVDPTGPSEGASSPTPSPSSSASRSASPSASRSASTSASPSTSRSSAPPSTTPSASASRSASPPQSSAPPPPAALAPTLRYGDSGAEVEKLQRLLAEQGLYRGRLDGKFGRSVRNAVEDLQAEFGIHDDPWGVYGPATRRALEG